MEKGENAGYQRFLLFQEYFLFSHRCNSSLDPHLNSNLQISNLDKSKFFMCGKELKDILYLPQSYMVLKRTYEYPLTYQNKSVKNCIQLKKH